MKNIFIGLIMVAITIIGSILIININRPVENFNANDIVEKMESIVDGYNSNYNVQNNLSFADVIIGGLDRPKKTTYSDELDRTTAIKLAEEFSEVLGIHYKLEKAHGVGDREVFTIRGDNVDVKIHFKQ